MKELDGKVEMVYLWVRAYIEENKFSNHSKIPSENALNRRLTEEKLLRRVKGSGTYTNKEEGGGPINLVVLYYFFSMDAKTAAANSLYVIFFSQLCNYLAKLLNHAVPPIRCPVLALMVAGGICGGIIGRKVNSRIEGKTVERLFLILMVVIICISVFNTWRYAVS